MNSQIFKALVLPLVSLAIASLYMHKLCPNSGFFINLTTELIGIVITIAYVDWIIKKHERQRWEGATLRIYSRLNYFLNVIVTNLRSAFGVGTEFFDQSILQTGNPKLITIENMRFGTQVLAPITRSSLEALDQVGWKNLAERLQEMSSEADRLIERFSTRLDPRELEILLDIQQSLNSAQISWRIFPDILGVPEENLPTTKTPPKDLQTLGCSATAADIQKVLSKAQELSSYINSRPDA